MVDLLESFVHQQVTHMLLLLSHMRYLSTDVAQQVTYMFLLLMGRCFLLLGGCFLGGVGGLRVEG